MTKSDIINDRYFAWICDLICDDSRKTKELSYWKLLSFLYDMEFSYIIPMDDNRAEDGIDLRYRFRNEKRIEDAAISSYLDDRPCSVLEMMAALAIRCEEHIMEDPDIGNRTDKWFWDMITSLGLESMDDIGFDMRYVNHVITKFLERKYKRNGKGGLFTVKHCARDMRTAEIWYQMCWYLDDIFLKENKICDGRFFDDYNA